MAKSKKQQLIKYDALKERTDLLSVDAILEMARVMSYGASKYSERNWEIGTRWGRYYAAALRHLLKWWGKEDNDVESGIHHLAHAACCCMFLYHYVVLQIGEDDRPNGRRTDKIRSAKGRSLKRG